MIISHERRFILVRTEKTAGSSIQAALAPLCQPGDDVSTLNRPAWAKWSPIHHGALKRTFPRQFGLHVHATIGQVKSVVGERIFNSYFKFAVERNPWDRQVSLYYDRERKKNRPNATFDGDLTSLLYRWTEYVRLRNWEIYTIRDQIAVDYVIRYEELKDGLAHVFSEIGVSEPVKLPKIRSDRRKVKGKYRELYTDRSRDLVAKWYRREIDHFGYEF